jgi:hypothetical protein
LIYPKQQLGFRPRKIPPSSTGASAPR